MNREAFGQGDFVENIRLFYGAEFDVMGQRSYKWLPGVSDARPAASRTRVRGLVTGALTAARSRHGPRIREITDRLINDFAADREGDLIARFAYELPVRVMCDMLGIDPEDARLKTVIDAIAQNFIVFEARALTDAELATAADSQIAVLQQFSGAVRRTGGAQDSLATALVGPEAPKDALSHDELVPSPSACSGAGFETTAHMIGNGLLCFSRFPDQWRRLVGEPETLAAGVVDEVLRYEKLAHCSLSHRAASGSKSAASRSRRAKVLTLIGAGNRDPRLFDDPDRFDIGRGNAARHQQRRHSFCVRRRATARRPDRLQAGSDAAAPGLTVDVDAPAWREKFLFRGMSALRAQW